MSLEAQFLLKIAKERTRQNDKWGLQIHRGHAWTGILAEEFGEVAKAINEDDMEELEKELVQVAAVCCAMWEQLMDDNYEDLNPQFGFVEKGEPKEHV